MGLRDKINDTKFRSLRFGNDTPGGGSSGQPYVTVSLNNLNSFNTISSRYDDGFIRGGAQAATIYTKNDVVRISKFLREPKGILFLTRQAGLQLSNPALETIRLTPNRSGLFGNIINSINTNIGPTRIFNAGVNLMAQIAASAFGGHIQRHGLTPFTRDAYDYKNVAITNDLSGNNRLVSLAKKFELGDNKLNFTTSNLIDSRLRSLTDFLSTNLVSPRGFSPINNLNLSPEKLTINKYIGGPNSFYGIGQTIIKRYDNTEDGYLYKLAIDRNYNKTIKIDYYKALGLSNQYFNNNEIGELNNIFADRPTNKPEQIDQGKYSNYNELKNEIDNPNRTLINGGLIPNEFKIINTDPITGRVLGFKNTQSKIVYDNNKLGSKQVIIRGSWDSLNRETRVGSGLQDSINLTPLFLSKTPPGTDVIIDGKLHKVRDLIKFRIEAVDTDSPSNSVWMVFRAYLKGIRSAFSPEWSQIKYIGRGDTFELYNGFNVDYSFTFQVAALSEEEMQPMYQKLNYLAASVMPDYDEDGIMRAPYHRLTIGNWTYRQPGVIKNLTYEISDETPWEIAIDEPEGGSKMYELPHIVNVSISFKPIYNFLPEKSPNAPFIVDRDENPWINDLVINNSNNNIPRLPNRINRNIIQSDIDINNQFFTP